MGESVALQEGYLFAGTVLDNIRYGKPEATRILVLTDNGIEEEGTHQELIGLNGIYANLYNMQLMIEDVR